MELSNRLHLILSKKNITRLVSVAFMGALLGRALRYSLQVVISRGLGADALGLFAFGMVVMKASSVLSQAGLDRAVQKFIPIYQTEGNRAKTSGATILCLVISFLVSIISGVVIYVESEHILMFTSEDFGSIIQFFIIGIPLFSVMMIGIATTKGFKETKYAVYIRDIGQSTVALLFAIIGAFIISDFTVVIAGYILSLFTGAILSLIILKRLGALSLSHGIEYDTKRILSFSLPLTMAAVSLYFISWTDILMLGVFKSATEVGWYQASYQTSILLAVVLQSANSIFPSIASDLYHEDKVEKLNRIYMAVTKWVFYFTVLGLIFLVIYSNNILKIFGEPTAPAVTALIILGMAQAVAAVTGPVGYLLTMSEYERIQMVNAIMTSAINIMLNYFLIQEYGVIGAAAATGISLSFLNLVRLIQSWYLLRLQPYSRSYWKGVLAIGVTTPIMSISYFQNITNIGLILINGLVAFLVFLLILYYLGLDDVDKELIHSL